MLEFKQNTQIRVPVRLLSSTNSPVASVAYSAVTVTIEKADGTTYSYVPTNTQWVEVTTGAFLSQGKYDLIITSGYTDQVGPLCVAVAATGAQTFIGVFKVIANETADVYSRIGAPTGASVSADIAALVSGQTDLLDYSRGTWQIFTTGPDANRMVFYRADGVTVLKKFNLFGSDGTTPTYASPFVRVPV